MSVINKPELMAPLKNFKSLNAVINYADAVYFGVEALNMRMYSDNFMLNDLKKVSKLCKNHGIKSYLTVNIILYDNEIELTKQIIDEAYTSEIDAIIAHDLAAIRIAKEVGIDFHISTQANVSNTFSAEYFQSLGAKRIILARELSLEQIKRIKNSLTTTEIETFVHGAQCTAVSGRCYFSAEICESENFSANRGKCIHPCRREWQLVDSENHEIVYDGAYFFNTKDLCMIEYIPELVKAKIDAFKIEGRMRDPLYSEVVTKCYRTAIDAYYNNAYTSSLVEKLLNELETVYNRGFSTGFYFGKPESSEIERKRKGNVSDFRKIEIGRVLSYFPDKGAAKILLSKGKLKLDDEVIFISKNADTYLRQKINSIQFKQKKNLSETPIASKENKLAIGIKVDKPVKKNDIVFKNVKKKNY